MILEIDVGIIIIPSEMDFEICEVTIIWDNFYNLRPSVENMKVRLLLFFCVSLLATSRLRPYKSINNK